MDYSRFSGFRFPKGFFSRLLHTINCGIVYYKKSGEGACLLRERSYLLSVSGRAEIQIVIANRL